MYKENHSLNEWLHEANGGEPEIQVPEKRRNKCRLQLEEGIGWVRTRRRVMGAGDGLNGRFVNRPYRVRGMVWAAEETYDHHRRRMNGIWLFLS